MRDLPQMQKIYARARALMAANGNPTQWGNEFPRESMIEDDIANQRTMLLVDTCNGHERILAMSSPFTCAVNGLATVCYPGYDWTPPHDDSMTAASTVTTPPTQRVLLTH